MLQRHWAALTCYMLLEHTCWVLVSFSPSSSSLAPLPPPSKPSPVSWQCGERAVGLRLCLRSPGFTESFSRTEMVRAVLPSPTPCIHVSAWRYMPSDLRRTLTRRPIRWLLLAWLFITNTVAKAHSTAVYAFNPWWGADLFVLINKIKPHPHWFKTDYHLYDC